MKRAITILTGFLGSGKTTLLARALADPSMRNTAVLVNEFGEVGIDHHLLRRTEERTILLGNGCVCCSTREDLVGALLELLDQEDRGEIPPLERVVIETTGLADPAPIPYTIFSDPVLQHHFIVDLVIATVDAINGDLHLDHNPESIKQVVAADKLVVTKTDLAEKEATQSLIFRLGSMNPSARVVEAVSGQTDAGELFEPVEEFPGAAPRTVEDMKPELHNTAETHSISLTFDGAVDWTAFGIWLSMLLYARGEDVLRVKGILDVGEAGPVVLNGVQHIIHPPEHLEKWPDEEHYSRIILISKHIEPHEILASLRAFRHILGAEARPLHLEHASSSS